MMRSISSAAVAVVTLAVVGMAGIPARMSTHKSPAADAAPTTAATTTTTTIVPTTTTTTIVPTTTTTTIAPTTTTMVMTTTTVGRRRVASSTVPTVAIPTPAQAAALRAHARRGVPGAGRREQLPRGRRESGVVPTAAARHLCSSRCSPPGNATHSKSNRRRRGSRSRRSTRSTNRTATSGTVRRGVPKGRARVVEDRP